MHDNERRERAEARADILALVGFVVCVAIGGSIGMLLFGPPGLVVGAVITAPLSLPVAAMVNHLPFMKDVY
ncbi:MAG: hypothetical protein K1X95_15760 [Acidimicrobiia bacterium]|nr:hypothetical protein [Acidimicrobiia bacterium]